MKKKIFKALKIFLILSIGLTIALYNDLIFRPAHYPIDRQLRYLDHLLASLAITESLFILLEGELLCSAFTYAFSCLVIELLQVSEKGYFQFDQYIVDVLGVVLIIVYHKLVKKDVDLIKERDKFLISLKKTFKRRSNEQS